MDIHSNAKRWRVQEIGSIISVKTMRANHRFPQCKDTHGHWCPGCLAYLHPRLHPERHHLIPVATLSSREVRSSLGSSADLLRRKLLFCGTCHEGVQKWADLLGSHLRQACIANTLDDLAFSLDRKGMFEISAALHARHLNNRFYLTSDVRSVANNYLFAAGGAGHCTHSKLEFLWQHARTTKDVNLALTLAGPAINSGHIRLASEVLSNVELELGIKSLHHPATLRRRVMMDMNQRRAKAALEMSVGTSLWAETTARVLCAQASLSRGIRGLDAAYGQLNEILQLDNSTIVPLADRLDDETKFNAAALSIFHLACALSVDANCKLIDRDWPHALMLYYQVQFLRSLFGLRLLPSREHWSSSDSVRIVDPEEPIWACIHYLNLEPEDCVAFRRMALGRLTIGFAYNRLTSVTLRHC